MSQVKGPVLLLLLLLHLLPVFGQYLQNEIVSRRPSERLINTVSLQWIKYLFLICLMKLLHWTLGLKINTVVEMIATQHSINDLNRPFIS